MDHEFRQILISSLISCVILTNYLTLDPYLQNVNDNTSLREVLFFLEQKSCFED